MNQKKLSIIFVLFVIIAFFFSDSSWAQEARENKTFFCVVSGSGIIGFCIWILIFFLLVLSPVLGIISIVLNSKTNVQEIPLLTKSLKSCAKVIFILGVIGVIWGAVDSFNALAGASGDEKARILAQCIANAIFMFIFSVLGSFGYIAFYIFSNMIFHSRNKKAPESLNDSGA